MRTFAINLTAIAAILACVKSSPGESVSFTTDIVSPASPPAAGPRTDVTEKKSPQQIAEERSLFLGSWIGWGVAGLIPDELKASSVMPTHLRPTGNATAVIQLSKKTGRFVVGTHGRTELSPVEKAKFLEKQDELWKKLQTLRSKDQLTTPESLLDCVRGYKDDVVAHVAGRLSLEPDSDDHELAAKMFDNLSERWWRTKRSLDHVFNMLKLHDGRLFQDNLPKLKALEAYARFDTSVKNHRQLVIQTLIRKFGDELLSSILMDGTEHAFCRDIATELQDEMMANWKGRKISAKHVTIELGSRKGHLSSVNMKTLARYKQVLKEE
uniref:RxLR effector candidate protein n=1 Tax=Hyaloperonospora arabidopsidis (strain Emoy2) TaxID=559515 RepID=M4BSD4_HYAAE|nr:RxLR effector candidate protein [Hyaloperonospora arabidopsidis Emoy2]